MSERRPEHGDPDDLEDIGGQKERREGMQNPIDDVGASPDPGYDGNERADDRVRVEQPGGGEVPEVSE